jgi:hypothetical protein
MDSTVQQKVHWPTKRDNRPVKGLHQPKNKSQAKKVGPSANKWTQRAKKGQANKRRQPTQKAGLKKLPVKMRLLTRPEKKRTRVKHFRKDP